MEIRTARTADIPALYALWHEAFGDERAAIDAFFQTCFAPENTFVAVENGAPVSVLYWIEAAYQTGSETLSARYVFAAATAKDARSNGYMTALLRKARQAAAARQIDLLFLVPAEETLFAYYGARGFRSAFSKTVYILSDAQLRKNAGTLVQNLPETPASWANVRKAALQGVPHIVWSESALSLALRYSTMFGEEVCITENGWFNAGRDGETVTASEFCTVPGSLPALCGAVLEAAPAKRYTLSTPCGMPVPASFMAGETVANGMLLSVSERAKRMARTENAYIGITLG